MVIKSKLKKRPADRPVEKRRRTTKRKSSRVGSQYEINTSSTELQKLNFVTGNLGIGLLVISKDYRPLWANEVIRQKYGDVEGKTCYLTFRQLPDICPECGVKKVFETGISQAVHEVQRKDPEGNMVWEQIVAAPIKDEDGNITAVLEAILPITERKKAEEILKESEEKFRLLTENSVMGIYIIQDSKMAYVNPSFASVFGYKPEEIINTMNPSEFIHPDDKNSMMQRLADRYAGKVTDRDISFNAVKKDGSIIHIEATAALIKYKDNPAVMGTFLDTTERKKAEEQLERWAHVFENAEWGISISTAGSDNLDIINPAYARMHSYTVAELTGRSIADVYAPESRDELAEHIRLAMEIGHHTFESKHIRKDGTVFPVAVDITAVKDMAGQVLYRVANTQDVTDYKRAEEALRLSATEWRTTFDAMNVPICLLSIGCRIQRCNTTMAKLLKKPFDEIVGQPYWSMIYGTDVPVEECPAARVLQSHHRETSTLQLFDRWFDIVAEPISDEAGNITGLVYTMLDITERKKAEEALSENEERYRSLVDTSPDMITVTTPDGKLAFINNAGVKLLGGTSPEQFVGKPVLNYISPPCRRAATGRIKEWAEGKRTSTYAVIEEKYVRLDGTEVDVELVGAVIVYQGKPAMQVVSRNITERKKADEALRESEERYRTLFESAIEGIVIGDYATKTFKYANPAFCKMLGYSEQELSKLTAADIHPKEAWAQMASYHKFIEKRKKVLTTNMPCLRKDGSIVYADIHSTPTVIDGVQRNVAFFTDVTQRKLAEEEQKRNTQNLLNAMKATVQAMSMMVEMRDPYTSGHQQHVADLATAIATEMGLPEKEIEGIRLAGVIHDIGKIYVPAEILSKPGRLSEIEFRMIMTHPQVGHDILKTIEFPWPIAQIVLQHHERMDGSGYPAGLSGEDILPGARTLAVADVVEAMASHRPYRPALGVDKALEEISQNKGILYDAKVADACISLFHQKGFKLE